MVERRVVRRQHERGLGRNAECDRVANDRVDVPVGGDVLGLAVVGAEGHPLRAVLDRERRERLQVPRRRRLSDEQPHAGAEPLSSLLDR